MGAMPDWLYERQDPPYSSLTDGVRLLSTLLIWRPLWRALLNDINTFELVCYVDRYPLVSTFARTIPLRARQARVGGSPHIKQPQRLTSARVFAAGSCRSDETRKCLWSISL